MPGSDDARDYTVETYPSSRVATFDVGKLSRGRHHTVGLLEVDVTDARRKIKERIRRGEDAGFIPWFLKTLADTVSANPAVQGINARGRKQILFRDVDISLPLERTVEGKKVPLMALIRRVNGKSREEIYREIREGAERTVAGEGDYVLTEGKERFSRKLFFHLPQVLRLLVWKILLRNPRTRKENMGTVIVTNVGGAGGFSGWIIPRTIHNLAVGIGAISRKPWVVGQEIVVREILQLTVIFDHDVVDGAPAARFTGELVRNLTGAYGL